MKVCSMCKEEKPYAEFGKHKGGKDGLRSSCKKCNVEYSSEYRKLNPEKILAQSISWNQRNPGASAAISKAWREENPEAHKESTRKYVLKNQEKISEYKRSWRVENKDVCRSYQRKRRAIKIGAEGSHTAADIVIIFEKQNGLCANCETKLFKSGKQKFHVDHITPLSKGGTDWPSNLQCLCPECNLRKHAKDPFEWAKENGRLI